jgi:D-xylose transport system permease protein
MLGMAIALGLVWVAFDIVSEGLFLAPRNLYNLAVQSSVVGVMACGMVLVIVARHIDLSVGSLLGFTGMAIALLQVELAWPWPASLMAGLLLGALAGAAQGVLVAYGGLPAFVVTLGGLLIFRGSAYLLSDGQTLAPLASGYARLGGGPDGSLGAQWSLLLGALAVLAVVAALLRGRAARRAYGEPLPPAWLEATRTAVVVLAIAAFVGVMNAHTQPRTDVARGIPIPVLILIAVALTTTGLARATRFGRYVFAIGGSPEAAELAGIDVRRITVAVFVWMGILCAVGAIITTARLGAGASSMGTLAELNVIAAAVIGGTSLSGGRGSVPGAILGAVIMQSLENGMVLLGVSSPLRQVGIGAVLIAAVWVDVAYARRRT